MALKDRRQKAKHSRERVQKSGDFFSVLGGMFEEWRVDHPEGIVFYVLLKCRVERGKIRRYAELGKCA